MIQTPGAEIAGRLATLQALLAKHDVDAAIVRQNADLFYLTGTVQDAHLIVPASGQPVFLVADEPAQLVVVHGVAKGAVQTRDFRRLRLGVEEPLVHNTLMIAQNRKSDSGSDRIDGGVDSMARGD